MIRLFLILILSLSLAESTWAQQALFDEATHEFTSGDLERARTLYRQLESEGHHSPELFWNQAMVALESDSVGLAKYYLLRTSRYDSWRDRSEDALDHIEEMLARRSSVLPPLPWDRLLLQLRTRPGADLLLWFAIFLFHLGVITWIISRLREWEKRPVQIGLYIVTGVAFSLLFSSIAIEWREAHGVTGIQVGEQNPVYQRPDTTSAVVATLYEGYRVTFPSISATQDTSFRYVRLENGLSGWVYPQQIRTYQGSP